MTNYEPAADPDFAHLLDLLAMLPGPTEDRAFWAAVWPRGQAPDHPLASNTDYVFEKMAAIPVTLAQPTPQHVAHLAKYLLIFFAVPDPELWRLLNRVGHGWQISDGPRSSGDLIGRIWAEDLSRTAWALYVRYSTDDRWQSKWHFEANWLEWLPERAR